MSNLANKPPLGLKANKPAKATRKGMRKVSKKRAAHWKSAAGKAEARHMANVKGLPCVICKAPPPSDAHHCFHGRYGSKKESGFETIPLCKAHHQNGPEAIHNGKATWAAKHGPDYGYLKQVRADLAAPANIDF